MSVIYTPPTAEEQALIQQFDWLKLSYAKWAHAWMPWTLVKALSNEWHMIDATTGKFMNRGYDLRPLLVHAALVAGGKP